MAQKTKNQFDPEKYGMTICPHCNGSGSLQNGPDGMNVCMKCGGFGLVKKRQGKIKQIKLFGLLEKPKQNRELISILSTPKLQDLPLTLAEVVSGVVI